MSTQKQAAPIRHLMLALCLLVLAGTAPDAWAARRALVIGIDSYQHVTRLRNARADAEAMADALRSAGYRVTLQTDRSQKQMQGDVRAFRDSIVANQDEVVVFFSGHGVQVDGTNYLLPVDIAAESESQVKDDALALSKVLQDLRERKPRFTLAIVDACRDNPFAGVGRSIGARGLTGVSGATGQMVIYAAGEGQKALDRLSNSDPVRNGLFTRVFVKEMARPGLSVDQVLRNVRIEVNRLALTVGHDQVPALYDQVVGNYYFHTAPAQVASVVPQPVGPSVQLSVASAVRDGAVFKDCADCPEMVVIPAGSFLMGSPASESDRFSNEGPQRRVTVVSFALGKTEVTQGQWKAVMGGDPSRFSTCGDDCPVENVSWEDAQRLIEKLNAKTGQRYRLPSEAEWEYAARAGTLTAYWWGPLASHEYANYGKDQCCDGVAEGRDQWENLAPVGQFAPNAFGLHDMHGNVWEWVQDCYDDKAYGGKAPSDGGPYEVVGCSSRVLRGGSWYIYPQYLRSAYRNWNAPGLRNNNIGFRLARMLP